MSITSAARPTARNRLSLLLWSQVVLGLAGAVAILSSPLSGLVAGVLLAVSALAVRGLRHASLTVERIFEEELDR
ncbi:hypothetical protein [Saccharothrix xinjiangensis]|uniref:Sensor histidine kinase n=1 Tax=Saccharothrix xinjiangensis TaxID=204798 RepID=A0ABV9XZ98_9PSEU